MCNNVALWDRTYLVLSAPAQTNSKPATPQTQSAAPAQAKTSEADELVKQAQTLASDGKADEALALYQRALQLDPDNYQAQLFTGVALDLQGNYPEARQHLAKAIQLASEQQTVQALRVMAVSYAFERNTDKASDVWKFHNDPDRFREIKTKSAGSAYRRANGPSPHSRRRR